MLVQSGLLTTPQAEAELKGIREAGGDATLLQYVYLLIPKQSKNTH
jgi:hypothetical protein